MQPSLEASHEDDASGEAWFQKGMTLLEERKREREFEEALKKRMEHSAFQEPSFLLGVVIVAAAVWSCSVSEEFIFRFLLFPLAGMQFFAALESASQKRMKAMLEWIEHQKSKQTPEN
jgi:hypothetical protein